MNWPDWQAIQTLCKERLSTVLTLEAQAELDEKALASIERQKIVQSKAIEEEKVQKIAAISYHTLIDKLAKRTSKAEYKFQTSWTPLFDDKE